MPSCLAHAPLNERDGGESAEVRSWRERTPGCGPLTASTATQNAFLHSHLTFLNTQTAVKMDQSNSSVDGVVATPSPDAPPTHEVTTAPLPDVVSPPTSALDLVASSSAPSAPPAPPPLPLREEECAALWRYFLDSILGFCEGFDDGDDYHCAGAIYLARLAVALRPPSETATLEEWHNAITLLFIDIPADVRGPWNTWLKNEDILEGLHEAAQEVTQCIGSSLAARLRVRANTGTVGESVRARLEEVKKSTKGAWQRRIELVREAGELRGL
jgi:hypothetical protein